MIRRQQGNEFFLITQNDHAILSGELAKQFGNDRFAPPHPRESVITATAMHDAGWPLHDDAPTLNSDGLPLDVFEVPRQLALRIWTESAQQAADLDPYAGLLVSLHSMALSVRATTDTPMQHEKFDTEKLGARFELNKFQHREIERQEHLRNQLGLRCDVPLTHGLADFGASLQDDQLNFNFHLLEAMDLLSLCLCCTNLPAAKIDDLPSEPQMRPLTFKLRRSAQMALTVSPWPFEPARIELTVPFRRLPGRVYQNEFELREIYSAATIERLPLTIRSS